METKIEIQMNDNLESIVYTLLAAKARKERAYCEFNGHTLHSDTVTMDSAYLEVTGYTKEEFDKILAENERQTKEQNEKELQEAIENKDQYIERGKELVYPQKQELWEKCVNEYSTSGFSGQILKCAVEVMEALNSGATMEQVDEIIKQQGHGNSLGALERIIFDFSKRGPEYIEHSYSRYMPPEVARLIEEKKQENAMFAENVEEPKHM